MFNKLFKSRKFKYGSVATIMTVIFIAAVVVFNIVAIMLVDRLPVKVDLTDNQIFDISDETEEFLDDITEKITIVITAEEAKFTASTGVYTQHLNEIIKNFAIHGKDISVKYVDLLQNPDFVADYEGTISEGQIIVESAKRYRVMAISEMFNITYNNYGQMQSIDSSKAEQELVSALMYVTDQSPETVQILGGR
ncbi:MAG TPA: Gldg family protein, partial [Oscillospiraceae bacterium]|nr:Gldg family protein [Oscillospiraceae bacterium]